VLGAVVWIARLMHARCRTYTLPAGKDYRDSVAGERVGDERHPHACSHTHYESLRGPMRSQLPTKPGNQRPCFAIEGFPCAVERCVCAVWSAAVGMGEFTAMRLVPVHVWMRLGMCNPERVRDAVGDVKFPDSASECATLSGFVRTMV